MEQSLNLPLSGTEVRKAICDRIGDALLFDDRLSGHSAFRGFSFKATIEISLPGAVYENFERELAVTVGELGCSPEVVQLTAELPDEADKEEMLRQGVAEDEPMPVDMVRVQTDQPITVAAVGRDGQVVERQVSFEKPKRGRPKKNAKNA